MIKFRSILNEDISIGYPTKADLAKWAKKVKKARSQTDSHKEYQYHPITEMPHLYFGDVDYEKFFHKWIDFRIERMNISKDEKRRIMLAFHKGSPVVGKLKSGKYLVFTGNDVTLHNKPPKNSVFLPDGWVRFIRMQDD